MATLTDKQIKAALTGNKPWRSESMGRGRGSLVLKAAGGKAHWYYRYTVGRQSRYWPIGPYGDRGLTLKAAREEAGRLAAECRATPDGDLHAHRERQAAAERERLREEQVARERALDAAKFTVRRLVRAYLDYLEKGGKSGDDARRCLTAHVLKSKLADSAARDLSSKQAADLLRGIVDAGKGRMAAKVRSYLRAAYALAQRAEYDPAVPRELAGFGVESNPLAGTASLSKYNRARDRVLTESELREFWKRLQAVDGVAADACRLELLTGGQRWEQLLRARVQHFDPDAGTLTLFDPKGRREQARVHVVPLTREALEALKRLDKRARKLKTDWLFSSGGDAKMVPSTAAAVVKEISAAMVADGTASAPFTPSDLRRTAETRLAKLGVSSDVRAQLQSHGLGGIQVRHYDRHDYLDEKRRAVQTLADWLNRETGAKVVQIRKGKRR